MATTVKTMITVEAKIHAPVEKVWNLWTDPRHIMHWNHASDDWYTPWAENDVKAGGKFRCRMEARDGSHGFDFSGVYKTVVLNKQLIYTLDDDREVRVRFASDGDETTVTESFEAENENTVELQQRGWQAILDSFRKYAEAYGEKEVVHFEILINAPVEKVYTTMIDEKDYSDWTAEFNPSSHYIGSWEKGSEIRFLGTDKDGKMGGMFSLIRENIPEKFISIEHRGEIEDGKEMMNGSKVSEWTGALENYSFKAVGDATLLSVDTDTSQQYKSYFINTGPKALERLKSICEAK